MISTRRNDAISILSLGSGIADHDEEGLCVAKIVAQILSESLKVKLNFNLITLFPCLNMPTDTKLHKASHNGDLRLVQSIIETSEIDINAKGAGDRRPIHRAAGGDHTEIVKTLLSHGASVDAQDRSGRTPLHWACIGGNVASASLLVENGAPVLSTTLNACTPLHYSAEKGSANLVPVLTIAAGEQKNELLEARSSEGKTAAALAKDSKDKNFLKELKRAGDAEALTRNGCVIL